MTHRVVQTAIALTFLALAGCDDAPLQARPTAPEEDPPTPPPVFAPQLEALHKAQALEAQMQRDAEARARALDAAAGTE